MKVGILGGGGREHALGYSISLDERVDEAIFFPGNTGTLEEKGINVPLAPKSENFHNILHYVQQHDISTIIVGPEQPLVDGFVDFCHDHEFYRVFGPDKAAAQIEANKFFSYDLMEACEIPQAVSIKCGNLDGVEKAIEKIATKDGVVLKARGLTGGKGVLVCDSKEEALAKVSKYMETYGKDILVAERLFGQEFSVFGISDGWEVVPLGISVQDHKPLLDNDQGPNTGGMGAYAPAPIADTKEVNRIADKIMTNLVHYMYNEGMIYQGFLYAGMIMTDEGAKVLEFNCRFGDPEAQPAVQLLKNSLHQSIEAALDNKIRSIDMQVKPGSSICVVMASKGYPVKYDKGLPMGGLNGANGLDGVKVFHAGTKYTENGIVTNGGRVLGVTAYSEKGLANAISKAYTAVDIIEKSTNKLNNKPVFIYRTDIGAKGL